MLSFTIPRLVELRRVPGWRRLMAWMLVPVLALTGWCADAHVGVGAKPPPGAEVLFDGTRRMLDEKWTYWEGPRFASALPIKWKIVPDPVDPGTVLMSWDPAAAGGKCCWRFKRGKIGLAELYKGPNK